MRLRTWGLLGAALAGTSCTPPPQEPEAPATLKDAPPSISAIGTLAEGEPHTAIPVEADDAVLGSSQALVTVVSFLDFQCGFCSRGFESMLALREKYSDAELRIVFKHLPLESHDQSFPAAVVGQAVQLGAGSEAFFSFAEYAFAHQAEIDSRNLANWAEGAGLERADFNELVSQRETAERVGNDMMTARRLGVDATPTFYINGKLVPGAQELAYFEQVINEEISVMMKAKGQWRENYQARVGENMAGSMVEALLSQDPGDYRVPVDGSPVRGNPLAKVTLVAFSDYECPFCKRAEQTLHELQKKHGDELRIVFKHLPLPFHEQAMPAARIAAAVHLKQGDDAFNAVSDAIFAASPQLDAERLRQLGVQHGLTPEEAQKAITSPSAAIKDRIQRDTDLADDVLARGTPHFFINGKRLSGARPFEQFDALIEHEKQRADEALARGIGRKELYASLQEGAESPGAPTRIEKSIPEEDNPKRGEADAPVAIHIFSDFECPYCRQGEHTLSQLEELFPGKLRVVWHDFPLPFHERALPAARAAREARKQKGDEAFWKMHSALFALDGEHPRVTRADLLAHGKALELDLAALEKAIDSQEHDVAIEKDIDFASTIGVRGTPAFVIGGYLVTGAKPLRYLERVVQRVLNEKETTAKDSSEPHQ